MKRCSGRRNASRRLTHHWRPPFAPRTNEPAMVLLSHGEEFEAMVRIAPEAAAAAAVDVELLWLEAVGVVVVVGLVGVLHASTKVP